MERPRREARSFCEWSVSGGGGVGQPKASHRPWAADGIGRKVPSAGGSEDRCGSPRGERSDPPITTTCPSDRRIAIEANVRMIAEPGSSVIVNTTYSGCLDRSPGIACRRRIDRWRGGDKIRTMPRLACFSCGRTLWATVPLAGLFAEERRCPRCGKSLRDDRRIRDRRVGPRRAIRAGAWPTDEERRASDRRERQRRHTS
jgi:hypothetical protein